MTDVAELQLKVTQTGIDAAKRGLNDVRKAGLGAEDVFNRVKSAAAGTAIGAGIVVGLKAMLTATVEAEAASAQLEARLRSTGGAAGLTKTQLLDLASALQGKTIFDDEAIVNAEALLLTFTRIGKDVFPKAVESILNVSTAMGTDLNSAALQVGKALNDPVKGITALSRAGIQFTVDQKATIKSLVDTGKTAEAQTIILGELETQMGGAARAARNTLGGSLKALQNAFGDLLEGDTGSDGVRGTRAAIEQLVATMGSNETKKAFGEIVSGVASITASVANGVNWLVKYNAELDKTMGRGSNAAGVDIRDAPSSISGYRTARSAQENMLKRAGVWHAPGKNDDASYRQRYEALVNSPDYKRVNQELENSKSKVGASFFGADGMQDNYDPNDSSARRRANWVQRPRGTSGAPTSGVALASEDGDAPGGTAARISKAADTAARQRDEEYARLKESLRTEEEAIAASYAEREAIISGSAKKGSDEEADLRARSAQQRDDELSQLQERKGAELDALRESLMTEEEAIRSSYERRKAMLDAMPAGEAKDKLAARLAAARDMELADLATRLQQKRDMVLDFMLTEDQDAAAQRDRQAEELRVSYEDKIISHEEYLAAKAALDERYDQGVRDRALQDQARKLGMYGDMFGALGQLAEQFARGDSKRAKRAFEVAKALNMAQVVMSTASGVMAAQDETYPMNIIEGIRIAALGAVQLAAVSGQQFSGAYDKGGRIPAGKFGIVGEKGMEFVEGPANVTGRNQTKRMLEQASQGGSSTAAPPIVNISTTVTRSGAETSTTASDMQDAKELSRMIDNQVRDVLQREQRQGGIIWKRENGR